jgi:hypothetical protein
MSKAEIKDAIVFKPETRELADKIKSHIHIDPKTGIADPEKLKTAYVDTLPEGITADVALAIDNHNTRFAAAGFLALGETGVPFLKKHKSINEVQATFPTVGKSKFEGVFERSSQVRAPGQEPTTKFGTGSLKLDFYGGSQSRGEFKKVRDHLTDLAASALSD